METYKDSNGREYKENDIVINPFFGDLWLVKYDENIRTKFYFSQYGFDDLYSMDIDEPAGFIILKSKGEPEYNELYDRMIRIGKEGLKSECTGLEKL